MRYIALYFLLLCGCSVFPSASTYQPVIVEVSDPVQYDLDFQSCHAIADNYQPGVSKGDIAQSTVEGASSNAAYSIINPLVPLAGAIGGAATATISGYDLIGRSSIRVLVKCLEEKSRRDRSFIIADPNG